MFNLLQVAASEAVGALRANLLRTLLSILGIVIGVAALVAILGLGDGMERFARAQLSDRTDVSSILVTPVTGTNVDGIYLEKQNVTPLTPADAATLAQVLEGKIERIDLMTSNKGWLHLAGDTTSRPARLTASLLSPFPDTMKALHGRLLQAADYQNADSVTVLNHWLASRLQPDSNLAQLIGRQLVWDAHSLRIVGVLPPEESKNEEENVPTALLPIQVLTQEELKKRPPAMKLAIKNVEEIPALKTRLEGWLAADGRGGTEHFMVRASDYWVAELKKGIMVFKIVFGFIIGLSILVGGIGVMNVLLMSVTERTREIGIRKALGAKRRAIAMQFLAESLAISVLGCLLGLLLGLLFNFSATPLVMHFADVKGFEAAISLGSFVVVMAVAVFIGIVFGTFPALKASKLSPVDAIRHE
jgi:putative ABC transport system permease protein